MLTITEVGAFTQSIRDQINANFQSAGFFPNGNVYYLDPFRGSDQNDGKTPATARATLAAGYAALVEGHNDVLALISNGLTTSTARLGSAFTWSKNAAHLVGVCAPSRFSQRARIAPTSGASAYTPLFTMSGAGNLFQNIEWFHGFTTGTTAQICMKINGSYNAFVNCHIAGMGDAESAADSGSRSIVITKGENFFKHCVIGLDTIQRTALNASIEFQSGAPRNVFEECIFPSLAGTTASSNLAILCASAASIDRITVFKNCTFYNAAAFSGGLTSTGVAKLLAAAGGALLFDNSVATGFTSWGYDTASKAEILLTGAATTNASGLATANS